MQLKDLNIFKQTKNGSKGCAERIARNVLVLMVSVIALIFTLFYFVGYNMPAMWDERYNSPMLTDVLLVLMILLLVTTVGVVFFSKLHSLRTNHTLPVVNGIRGKRITWGVSLGVIVVMFMSYMFIPAGEMTINGEAFSESLWLRMANMFVVTCLFLMLAGVAAIIFGLIKNRR